jgi:hypothetical protein
VADTHSALDQLHGSTFKRTHISQPPTMIPGITPTAISENLHQVTVEEVIDKDDPQAQAMSARSEDIYSAANVVHVVCLYFISF